MEFTDLFLFDPHHRLGRTDDTTDDSPLTGLSLGIFGNLDKLPRPGNTNGDGVANPATATLYMGRAGTKQLLVTLPRHSSPKFTSSDCVVPDWVGNAKLKEMGSAVVRGEKDKAWGPAQQQTGSLDMMPAAVGDMCEQGRMRGSRWRGGVFVSTSCFSVFIFLVLG